MNKLAIVKQEFDDSGTLETIERLTGSQETAWRIISDVLACCQNNPKLLDANRASLLNAGVQAAATGLPVTPSLGLAYLIPRKGKVTFSPSYRGERQLALKTGKYRVLNAAPLYDGQVWSEDALTGVPQITGEPVSNTIHSYFAYAEVVSVNQGVEVVQKTGKCLTVGEIEAHRNKHNPYWNTSAAWKNSPGEMFKKTVLKMVLKVTEKDVRSGIGTYQLDEGETAAPDVDIIDTETVTDGEIIDITPPPTADEPADEQPGKNADPAWRIFRDDAIDAVIAAELTDNMFSFRSAVRESALPTTAHATTVVSWFGYYRTRRDAGDDKAKAVEFADNKYLQAVATKNGG